MDGIIENNLEEDSVLSANSCEALKSDNNSIENKVEELSNNCEVVAEPESKPPAEDISNSVVDAVDAVDAGDTRDAIDALDMVETDNVVDTIVETSNHRKDDAEPDISNASEDVEMKIANSSTNETSEDVENDVYNMNEEIDSTMNSELDEERAEEEESNPSNPSNPSNSRPLKRPMEVITIDSDSDDSSICHVESYQATATEAKKLRKGYSSSDSSSQSSSSSVDEEAEEEEEDEDGSESDLDSQNDIITCEPSTSMSRLENPSKKCAGSFEFKLNEIFSDQNLDAEFLSHWSKGEAFHCKNLTLHNEPFQICILDDFLSDASSIDSIINDMNTLEWFRKIMDLYEFHRTADLKDLSWQRSIKSLYELLGDKVMKWVAQITNTELTHISASCALYGPGDHLLVHDDLLEDRKIAFIFYLAPWDVASSEESDDSVEKKEQGWTKSMGGELEFFSTDDSGKPLTQVKSLVPKNNTFAFFKVGHTSFHQVAEITSYDYPRLTINGWFHGPVDVDEDTKNEEEIVEPIFSPTDIQNNLGDWVTSIYLTPSCKNQITQKFEKTSEISLVNFFMEEKYSAILSALESKNVPWENHGPMNLRHYQTASEKKLREVEESKVLTEFLDMLSSQNFVTLLQGYTNLPIQSFCKLEVQKWTGGNYSVLPLKGEYILSEVDIIVYFGCPDRTLKGGSIIYLLPEEPNSDPIISVGLKNNALNIVYSEPGLAKFTKYISKLSFKNDECFYTVACSYRNTEVK